MEKESKTGDGKFKNEGQLLHLMRKTVAELNADVGDRWGFTHGISDAIAESRVDEQNEADIADGKAPSAFGEITFMGVAMLIIIRSRCIDGDCRFIGFEIADRLQPKGPFHTPPDIFDVLNSLVGSTNVTVASGDNGVYALALRSTAIASEADFQHILKATIEDFMRSKMKIRELPSRDC